MLIAKKFMVFILVFCILIVLKEIFSLVEAFLKNEHIKMTLPRQITLAAAISYIMTIICTGFSLF